MDYEERANSNSRGDRGSQWGACWGGDAWRQAASDCWGDDAWTQPAGDRWGADDCRTPAGDRRGADAWGNWNAENYWLSDVSHTAASSSVDLRPPQATLEQPHQPTRRGKRGGLMRSKGFNSTIAKTDCQQARAMRRETFLEAKRWCRVAGSQVSRRLIQSYLMSLRKAHMHNNSLQKRAAGIDPGPQPQDWEDDVDEEPVDDEHMVDPVLGSADRMLLQKNESVLGFSVFQPSSIETVIDQYFHVHPTTLVDHNYVTLPLLVAPVGVVSLLLGDVPGFVELVQTCALLCYRMVRVQDEELLNHDAVMQVMASTLQAFYVPAEYLLLKEYVVWVVRFCCSSTVCGFRNFPPVLCSLLDSLGMALDAEAKRGVLVEESLDQSLHCAISSVEMLRRPSAGCQSSHDALLLSISQDFIGQAAKVTSVPVIDSSVCLEPASKQPRAKPRPAKNHGSVRTMLPLPTKQPALVILNFMAEDFFHRNVAGELMIMAAYKSGSNLFQSFVSTQFDYAACQPASQTKKTGMILCDEFYFPRNGRPCTYLSIKGARYDMQDSSIRWESGRRQNQRQLWKHHVASVPTEILYPADTLTIIYLVRNPYFWIHSMCFSQEKYEMYPRACPAGKSSGWRPVRTWEWLMEPIYILHNGDCMIEYGKKFHFDNAIQYWCEHVQGFLSGNVTIGKKTQQIFYLKTEDLKSQTNHVTEQLLAVGIPTKSSVVEPVLEERHVGPCGVSQASFACKTDEDVRDAIPPHIMVKINNELHKYSQIMEYLEYEYMEPSQASSWKSDEVRAAESAAEEASKVLRTASAGIWIEEY